MTPTGSGKLIIYEIPNLVFDHLLLGAMDKKNLFSVVIIIQPLKALMEENTNRLKMDLMQFILEKATDP